jgi:hypothetical protein
MGGGVEVKYHSLLAPELEIISVYPPEENEHLPLPESNQSSSPQPGSITN